MTLDDIKIRLQEKCGDLITLADNQVYIKMIDPLIFIDRDFGEWKTSPNNVLNKDCVHPTRKALKRKETNIKLYGVDNVFKNESIKKKIKKSLVAKYGNDHPMRVDKIKQKTQETCLERYGAKSPLESLIIQDKIKDTLLQNYGVDNSLKSVEIRQKIKQTFIDKYGCDNPKKVDSVIEKTKQTCLERFNAIAPACCKDIQEKTQSTNLIRYGGIAPLCNPEIQAKARQTNLSRYGVENPFASKEIQAKITQINIEKYGIDHVADKKLKKCVHILPNKLSLVQYLLKYKKIQHYAGSLKIYKKYGFDILKEYIEGDKVFLKTSSLEEITEHLLGISRCTERVGKRKPDFKLSDHIYLDVDGLYWHSSLVVKDNEYHFKKRVEYEQKNLRLLQFRANEIEEKPHIVVSIVNNALNRNKKIYARKCKLQQITWMDAKKFLQQNHLQGSGSPSTSYGLFYNDSLVMVMCVRKKDIDGLEISRLCTLNNCTVVGGFNKLLAYVESLYTPELIYSWCDLRYANGKGYEAVGFKRTKEVLSWAWTDLLEVHHRLACRANLDDRKLTEAEYARELNLVRIYDAGQRLYVKVKNRLFLN